MLKIIFLIFCCFILYKCGVVNNFLNGFIIPDEDTPAADFKRAPHPAGVAEDIDAAPLETISEREKLEKCAHYILTARGYEYPETVDSMPDALLIKIIRDYTEI